MDGPPVDGDVFGAFVDGAACSRQHRGQVVVSRGVPGQFVMGGCFKPTSQVRGVKDNGPRDAVERCWLSRLAPGHSNQQR